jgi:hypothetical protein
MRHECRDNFGYTAPLFSNRKKVDSVVESAFVRVMLSALGILPGNQAFVAPQCDSRVPGIFQSI